MKNHWKILLGIMWISFGATAQLSDEEYQFKIDSVSKYIDVRAEILRTELSSSYALPIEVEYGVDTFRIESFLRASLELDYSTMGMSLALYNAREAYGLLIEKYVGLLHEELNEEDQSRLRSLQVTWEGFAKSENEFNQYIAIPEYSGGGTIQNLFVADRSLEICRNRVADLVGYLMRFAPKEFRDEMKEEYEED